jgi:hypothetical protein
MKQLVEWVKWYFNIKDYSRKTEREKLNISRPLDKQGGKKNVPRVTVLTGAAHNSMSFQAARKSALLHSEMIS